MSDADRLFLAVVILVAVYVFRVWEAKRRRFHAMMAAHCARVELSRAALDNGFDYLPSAVTEQLDAIEKGLGIRE